MPIALFIQLLVQVGEPLALELLKRWESNAVMTSADFVALKAQYGKSAVEIATSTGLPAPVITGS